ncbi:MAG: ComF family protein [Clostridia bacterium]|nr:ComF family protein [Clostridia bacterium]
MKEVKRILKEIISSIYPNKCVCCGEILDESSYICNNCNNSVERVNLDDVCLACGHENDECACKYNIFRFNSLVCAFKNTGLAKSAYYSYKFGKKQHYAEFFANEICNTINKCYSNINFNIICAVPSFQKFGYDHSGYIAKSVSKKLGLPFTDKLLSCVKKRKKQHKSTINERLHNVDGKYCANYRADNMNVLLIDDIKTTGATLDECAKVLLFAGADNVYCATALCASADKNINALRR